MDSRKLAGYIEILFFPITPIFVGILFILFYTQNMLLENIAVLSIITVIFLISHFTVRRRVHEENKKYFISSAIVSVAFFILAYFIGVSRELFFVAITLLVIAVFTYSIRPYWRISAHMIAFIAMVTTVSFFNIYLLSLFVIAPIIGWCRIKLKRHDIYQVVAGTILGLFIPLIIFSLFF